LDFDILYSEVYEIPVLYFLIFDKKNQKFINYEDFSIYFEKEIPNSLAEFFDFKSLEFTKEVNLLFIIYQIK